jgi:hypothetical protein
MNLSFKGKNTLITGASSGIGKHLAECFAKDGAKLFLSAHPSEEKALTDWAKTLKERYGVPVWTFTSDLALPNGPQKLFDEAEKAARQIEVLVNNAGILTYGEFKDVSYENLERMIQVNYTAYVALMRLAIGPMVERKSGAILNVASASAFQPTPMHAVYGATKSAVLHTSLAVAQEVRPYGVAVCSLNPSYTNTPLLNKETSNFPGRLRWFAVSGFPEPQTIAQKGYRAFKKGRLAYVPGPLNAFIHKFLIGLTPKEWVARTGTVIIKPTGSK